MQLRSQGFGPSEHVAERVAPTRPRGADIGASEAFDER
jgi:hypothetical protein